MKKSVLFFSSPCNHFYVSLCLCGLIAVLSTYLTQAQGITAGQSTGEKIIYQDIEDISIESSFWWDSDGVYLDLNDNGATDAYFWTNWVYYSHVEYEALDAGVQSLAPVEFSVEQDEPKAIRKHAAGEVIDGSLNWAAGDLIFYCMRTGADSGSFNGEGFVAYRICSSDTTYGWIHASRDVNSESRLSIYDYAFTTFYTGLGGKDRPEDYKIAVSGRTLFVDLPDHGSEYSLKVSDLSGRPCITKNLIPGVHFIDLTGVSNGIYIVRAEDHSGRIFTGKIFLTR